MNWKRSLFTLAKINNSARALSYKFGSSSHTGARNSDLESVFDAERIRIFRDFLSRQCSTVAGDFSSRGVRSNQSSLIQSRRFGEKVASDSPSDRDFLAQQWVSDVKFEESAKKRRRRKVVCSHRGDSEESCLEESKGFVRQPPLSQSVSGFFRPDSPEEVQL